MADRIAILNDGVLQQVAPPEEIYDDPTNRFVADFLGNPPMNQLPAVVERADSETYAFRYEGEHSNIVLATAPRTRADVSDGNTVVVGLRPEALSITPHPTDRDGFDATVAVTKYQGNDNFVHLQIEERELTAVVLPTTQPAPGDRVRVSIEPEEIYLFDPDTGETLRSPGRKEEKTSYGPGRPI